MKVLMLAPPEDSQGGVSNYCNTLKDKFQCEVDYCIRGRRLIEKKKYLQFKRVFKDYYYFINCINKYDLIHVNTSLGLSTLTRDAIYIIIIIIFKKKFIVFFRGWDKKYQELINNYFLWYLKQTYFKSNAIITLSSEFDKIVKRWGYRNNTYVETTVVDEDLTSGVDERIIKHRGGNNINLLFLSRIEKDKGIFELLSIYDILKDKYPHINLIISGEGSSLFDLKNYIITKQMKNVTITGFVQGDKKKQIYLKSDIFVFPTFHGEGMPNVVLEAMAFGLPVITRPVGGLVDFFEIGKMGFMTSSKEPEVFAKLISILIENRNKLDEIGYYNYRYAQNNFISSQVVKRLETIYSELCDLA